MSLAVNVNLVSEVLLADGWHKVSSESFDLDSYEFMLPGTPGFEHTTLHHGGESGVCATGFSFTDEASGYRVVGPLTAILAVRVFE